MEVVAAPELRPPRVGLLPSANTVSETTNRWESGIEFRRRPCGPGGSWVPCGPPVDREPSDRPGPPVTYRPVGLWAADECTAIAIDFEETRARARDNLNVWTSYQLEAELWGGAIADDAGFPNLRLNQERDDDSGTGATVIGIGPMDYTDALACLEQALGRCNGGGVGMIHATYAVATHWQDKGLLTEQGNLRLTTLGTIVVPGAGYDGSGPGDIPAADGSVWAYATGLVDVRLGEIEVLPRTLQQVASRTMVDNTVEVFAQRVAAATFDPCCHLAVEINAPVCTPVGS